MSGVPKTPTMTARVARPPTVPQIGERQPRVFPTARTKVKASTHSTTIARKAGTAATTSVNKLALILDPDSPLQDEADRFASLAPWRYPKKRRSSTARLQTNRTMLRLYIVCSAAK